MPQADGVPDEGGFFRGLAQAPLHFHNAIAELVDNAIAARGRGFEIKIDITDADDDTSTITVADNGPGIPLNKLESHVFKTGVPPPANAPHLNEHGFGLKNVLAKVEALQGNWELLTRDAIASRKRRVYEVTGPMRFKIPIQIRGPDVWPDYAAASTGTTVTFSVPSAFMQTVGWGKRGRPPKDPDSILDYLREHLGVYYRGFLGVPSIGYKSTSRPRGTLVTSLNWKHAKKVEPIEPDYDSRRRIKSVRVVTPAGKVSLEGEYGLLNTESQTTRDDRKYYYRNTLESQGVDLRVGDRILATRLLTEIWEQARHNSHNAFWGEFRIPGTRGKVPRTLNNKTSIDFDDSVWIAVSKAIKSQIPKPLKTNSNEKDENDLRDELYEQLEGTKLPGEVVEKNYPVWPGSGVVIDIYRKVGAQVIVYEAKFGKAQPLNVYQVRMYWDALTESGSQPTQAYLVAHEKTTGVSTVINAVNGYKDKNGKRYKIEFKRWEDYNVN